jgi:hypothetical protein
MSGFVSCSRVILSYSGIGILAILCRTLAANREDKSQSFKISTRMRTLRVRFVLVLGALSILSAFLPAYPWRHMTRTLLFDVAGAVWDTVLERVKTESLMKGRLPPPGPFESRKYSPSHDPYYISNLDRPIDDFIAHAIEDLHITNIVHIFLESMRWDSFPFQDDGLLNTHLHTSPRLNITQPISSNTITPFIASLAEHTLSWQTMWASAPFSHKVMMSRMSHHPASLLTLDICGMLPVPRDWSVEAKPHASWYQPCLPEVLRRINLVTNRDGEIVDIFNDSAKSTSDIWETLHIQSMSGEWDYDRELYKRMGFDAIVTAEEIGMFNGHKEWESDFGYFDEGPTTCYAADSFIN